MKPINVAVVFEDADTGKAYAREVGAWEAKLILAQLQELDGGQLKAWEVKPFTLRSVTPANATPDGFQALSEANVPTMFKTPQNATQNVLRGVHKNSVEGPTEYDKAWCYSCNQQVLKREVMAADGFCPLCDAEISDEDEPDDKALCYQCGQETRQRLVGDEWHCKACHAVQCERVRCKSCGKTCTRPEGAHYCKGGDDGQS